MLKHKTENELDGAEREQVETPAYGQALCEASSTTVMSGSHRNRQDLIVCLTANNEIGR